MKKVYFILLSNEGDFFEQIGKNMHRSTQNIEKSTKFASQEEAQKTMEDLSIRSIWEEARIESTLIS